AECDHHEGARGAEAAETDQTNEEFTRGAPRDEEAPEPPEGRSTAAGRRLGMKLTSPAFSDMGPVPRAHTCDGADLSPPLVWSDVPAGAKQLALIVDDPDAPRGVFVHWVLYGLSPDVKGLASGFPRDAETVKPVKARQGVNSYPATGYRGPCPPPG